MTDLLNSIKVFLVNKEDKAATTRFHAFSPPTFPLTDEIYNFRVCRLTLFALRPDFMTMTSYPKLGVLFPVHHNMRITYNIRHPRIISTLHKQISARVLPRDLEMASSYQVERLPISETGEECLFFKSNGQRISPWHDIPLFADDAYEVLNMVVEIPRQSRAKMEASWLPFLCNKNR